MSFRRISTIGTATTTTASATASVYAAPNSPYVRRNSATDIAAAAAEAEAETVSPPNFRRRSTIAVPSEGVRPSPKSVTVAKSPLLPPPPPFLPASPIKSPIKTTRATNSQSKASSTVPRPALPPPPLSSSAPAMFKSKSLRKVETEVTSKTSGPMPYILSPVKTKATKIAISSAPSASVSPIPAATRRPWRETVQLRETSNSSLLTAGTNSSSGPGERSVSLHNNDSMSDHHADCALQPSRSETEDDTSHGSIGKGSSKITVADSDYVEYAAMDASTVTVSTKTRKLVKSLQMGFLLTESSAPTLLDSIAQHLKATPARRIEFGLAQGIPALLKVMEQFSDERDIQTRCARILCGLSHREDNVKRIIDANGIVPILVAMLKHDDPETQEIGCTTLACLCRINEHKDLIAENSGIEVILTAMQAYPSNVIIQAEGCKAISRLCENHQANGYKVAAVKGIRAVMSAVQDHPRNREVQLNGVCAIRYLTFANDANRGKIASAGGIKTTLRVMKQFASDAILVENACMALWNLTIDHKHNASTIMTENGLIVVLAAMRQHEAIVGVQEAGCGVLRYITDDDRHGARVGSEGGITAILSAMRHFEGDSPIQQHGCAALCNLASDQNNVPPMVNAGGIGIIVSAMRQFPDNLEVQKNGTKALHSLANNDQNRISIAASGGISQILLAMRRLESNPGVQGLGVRTLLDLACNNRNKQTMKTNDGIEIIESAMSKYESNSFLQTTGKKLLMLLDPSKYPEEK